MAKIFEKVLKRKLVKFLDENKVLSEKQYGFREGLCTGDAVAKLVDGFTKCLEVSKPVLCVFLDLAKAFDTVDHMQMLCALEDVGVRGASNDLFADYSSNRRQVVKVNKILSDEAVISGDLLSFADDTAILFTDDTWESLKDTAVPGRYAILGWGGAVYSHLRPLDVMQKRIIKMMYGKSSTHSSSNCTHHSTVINFIPCAPFKSYDSIVSISNHVKTGSTKDPVNENQKEDRAKYGSLWDANINTQWRTQCTPHLDTLSSIFQVATKQIQANTPDTKIFQSIKKLPMIHRVKGLG
ncbi:uncharacterized protein LOC123314039 [Coccinella septempunctata]|uniref:uncharacterized protein LOC123314039 n=1 Tax=Coccinella septempunctata TaxID=41139 RepID=UPI001D0897C0|nr:uncharacterized protein LOC123314039 [Coccinella septempunctata]